MLIAWGRAFKKGYRVEGAGIMDLTPTILRLYGINPAGGMDGRVLEEMFIPGCRPAAREAGACGTSDLYGDACACVHDDDGVVAEKLKGLGYF